MCSQNVRFSLWDATEAQVPTAANLTAKESDIPVFYLLRSIRGKCINTEFGIRRRQRRSVVGRMADRGRERKIKRASDWKN